MTEFKNPYLGINAHLNSQLQNNNDWQDFHATYLVALRNDLKAQLLPLGYTVAMEQSLQIRVAPDIVHEPRADSAIFDSQAQRPEIRQSPSGNALELVLPISELLDIESPEDYFQALVISKRDSGEPVVWMELLSPTNKPPNRAFTTYLAKRREVLYGGLIFVEIDFLHQQSPTFHHLADYTRAESDSHPYRIAVIVPRPDMMEGKGYIHEFDADSPIPPVTIPLSGGDAVEFDFGAPYDRMFEEALYADGLEYRPPPLAFDRYSAKDRERILQRMKQIASGTD